MKAIQSANPADQFNCLFSQYPLLYKLYFTTETSFCCFFIRIDKDFVKKISAYHEALNLIYWDLRTGAPKEGGFKAHMIKLIEKGLFNDEIEVNDLPVIWNDMYEKYLGIRPYNDAVGVLQDVHWAGGSFGYFPSYALGYMYAAQFKQAMLKEIPNFDQLLEEGNLLPVKDWLTTNFHHYGKMKKPLEILHEVTGEGLNPNYLTDYLYQKYGKVYQLN